MINFAGPVYNFFAQYGLITVFLSMVIENLGIPFPTEFGYLAAIAAIKAGHSTLAIVLFILTLGHTVGATISYSVGKWGNDAIKRNLKESSKFYRINARVTKWYDHYGATTVFATRFIGYVRPWSSFVAGFADFPFWPFLLFTIVGSFLFNIIALYGSWVFVEVWQKFSRLHVAIIILMALLFFGVFIGKFVVDWTNKRKLKKDDESDQSDQTE